MKRRSLLIGLILTPTVALGAVYLSSPVDLAIVARWDIGALTLQAGQSVQLAAPSGAALGGTFGVATGGQPLPAGVTLSATGLLTVSPQALASSTAGVVFSYTER